ncbi:MAG: hypothetical protein KDB18_09820 [Salinibacterium sp.]|nr:hypothetical protein [Salinibacterium sp.]
MGKSKFSKVRKSAEVSLEPRPFPMPDVVEGAELLVLPAIPANKPFFNATLKEAAKKVKPKGRRQDVEITAESYELGLAENRKIYPGLVVVGWNGILDDAGNPVEFTAEDCADFLEQLPDWLFADLVGYCVNPRNFIDTPDGANLGKS